MVEFMKQRIFVKGLQLFGCVAAAGDAAPRRQPQDLLLKTKKG